MTPWPLLLSAASHTHAHLAGTLLPRGFFLGVGLVYLAALGLDRLAEQLRVPAAAAILLLGLAIPSGLVTQAQMLSPVQLETIHRVSLALLIFDAGLKTNLRRIRGMTWAGIRLATLGISITVTIVTVVLMLLAPAWPTVLPPAAAGLAMCCLAATDGSTLEDLLVSLRHRVSGRLTHLLQFEAALSTVMAVLAFGFVAGLAQVEVHTAHQQLHAPLANGLDQQVIALLVHLLAGLAAGLVVGGLAPGLIDRLVRSEPQLLLVTVALAFVAYGCGQLLGGGGLLAVFIAGVMLSNGRYTIRRFEQQALLGVMHPLNHAAEITVLLMLGLLVNPSAVITVLPVGVVLAIVLPIARWFAVWLSLRGSSCSGQDQRMVTGCGLRGAVALAMVVTLSEEIPHLRGVPAGVAEPLAAQLMALVFVVVLLDLLLQPLWVRRLQAAALSMRAEGSVAD